MKYSTIKRYDVANGPGIRTTIFVSGCTHKCKDCFNEELQDFNHGHTWDKEAKKKFLSYSSLDEIKGISILGGEPLQQLMDDEIERLLRDFKNLNPNKSIWLWTGDIFEEAIENEGKRRILEICDVVVDGPFIAELKDLSLKYRGSKNQRVIDVKATLASGKTTLVEF